MARVCAVEARICTWEVVTGFGAGELSREMLEDYFRRDFPDFEGMPRFWKMVSFNSAEGRRHRYLVIHGGTELRGRRERMVPRSTFTLVFPKEPVIPILIRSGRAASFLRAS